VTTRDQVPTQTSDQLLALDHVHYSFEPNAPVVQDVSFTVTPGEIISIVGPSGCGKSTLLRLIAGLVQPEQGSIQLAAAGAARHPCAMVFQEDTLLPWLRVQDNAELFTKFQGTKFRGFRRKGVSARTDELLSMVGLSQFARHYPYQLSGGMKRRLALVTAVASLPTVLLLDEPFSALDEPTRVAIHAEVYHVVRSSNVATILVTHDLAEALCLSDRILLMSQRPSHIVSEYRVPFGAERDMTGLRSDPRFLELYGQLWRSLGEQIAGGRQLGGGGPVRDEPKAHPEENS
jgi:NitT/TauT family transport system ATP-binding protein